MWGLSLGGEYGAALGVAGVESEGHAAGVEGVGICGEGELFWVFEVFGIRRKRYNGLSRLGTCSRRQKSVLKEHHLGKSRPKWTG